jgi:inositol phosphorylceramide mannosyltransferase catalytic subunit
MKRFFFFTFAILSVSTIAFSSLTKVDFDYSMSRSTSFEMEKSHQSKKWRLIRRLYKTYKPDIITSEYRIPPIIHFIWLGSPLPEVSRELIETWKFFHPGWTVKVWGDQEAKEFKMVNREAFDGALNYGEKSDIWRYEILYKFGGVYVDTDFECLRPFDDIHKSCDLYAGLGYTRRPLLYNGLIGAAPKHPIIKLCMDSIKKGPADQNDTRIQMKTGPYYFTNCFFQLASEFKGKIVAFPITYFYAFPNSMRKPNSNRDEVKRKWMLPESYALHYWATSWLKRPVKEGSATSP